MVTRQEHGSSQFSSSSSRGNAPFSTLPPNGSDDPSGSGSPAVPPNDDVSTNFMNAAENINGVMGPGSHKTANGNRKGHHPSYASTDAGGNAPLDVHRSTFDPPSTGESSQTAARQGDANNPDQLYDRIGSPPAGSGNTRTQRAKALPIASTSSGSSPPRAAHGSETQRGRVTGPDQISSSNSQRPSKHDNVPLHIPSRAEPNSEHNSPIQAPPIDRNNSSFTRNEETSYNAKESIEKKNTVEQRWNTTLDKRNGGTPGARGNYDAHRAQHPQTKPVSRSGSTHRIDFGSPHTYNAHESRETHKHLPEVPLTESPSASPTVSSEHPLAPPPSASLSPLAPNGDHAVFSRSDLATPVPRTGRRGMDTNVQPDQSGYHSPPRPHREPNVSTQPSPRPPPDTTNPHKPHNAASTHSQKRRGWSCIIRCECIRIC